MFFLSVLAVSTLQITLKLSIVIMSILVNQLTVEQAHKEFNSLVDKIAIMYEQLDSGKIGAVGTPTFNAKSVKLISVCYEPTMSKTEPANASTTSQAAILQALRSTFQIIFVE